MNAVRDSSDDLAFADAVARAAGKVLTRSAELKVERKSGNDIVTVADRAAEEFLLGRIREKYADDAILAEESGGFDGSSGWRWCVDPLDGTVNYASGIPLFAVSIALESRSQLELGVVYDPNRDELFSARRGSSTQLNGVAIEVRDRADVFADAVVSLGLPATMLGAPGAIERWLRECRGVRLSGSTAIELAWTAFGRYDLVIYRRTPARWDWAAGELLIAQAPGCAVRTLGEYGGLDVVVAGSSVLVASVDPAFFGLPSAKV